RLIEDLLDYSRVVAGKLHLAPQLMDLMPVVGAAMESVRSAAEAKGIRLELSTEAKEAMVHGDPDRLQQVLWNLLSNALKFTPQGGRVEVWIGCVGASVHVRVSDTGRGISRDFLRHVFERFRQQDGSSQRMQGGLGLGMAIVKELVELHGGTVHVESPGEGQGATFTISLPIPTPPVDAKAGEAGLAEGSRSGRAGSGDDLAALEGVRALIVEDEPDSREMLMTVFEQCGARVSGVASATAAMEALQQEPPDVLICDIGLAGEDGHSLMRRLRAKEAHEGGHVPAIALTAYAGAADRAKALAAGFDLQVSKPTVPADLVSQVALLIARRRRP
ncbi:MAG TPA: hybrid sensor histidine kinase/response regulator, partial [Vicinamibacteria bacterium]